jgi:diacylglycerol O-acyltransferase / wax synthase
MEHLSGVDASFLHFETPETPMHIGGFILLEPPPGYDGNFVETVKTLIRQRMHLAATFGRKLATMPFELAEPVWIDDEDIDLDHHVRSVSLARPGTMANLHQLLARLHSTLLDRSRPLWEISVIEGLENGQIALYIKTHHSGVDGKSNSEMVTLLFDDSPTMREVPPPRRSRRTSHGYQLGVAEMMQAAWENSQRQYQRMAGMLPAAMQAFQNAGSVMAQQRRPVGERALELGLAPSTLLNHSITNQRSYSTMSMSLEATKALGKRVGGTVNTIVMTMCSIALRRFLQVRNELPAQSLIASVPVSLRAAEDSSNNNQVSSIRVDLATDIAALPERFQAIHASSEAAKAVVRELKPVLNVDVPLFGAPWLMTGMSMLYGRADVASRVQPSANVMISNVPGPLKTLYMAGARMRHYYPMSIPFHGLALNITVHSYDGQLEWGLMACRRIVSQEESYELIEYLQDALKDIEALSGASRMEVQPAAAFASQITRSIRQNDPQPVSGRARKKKPAPPEAKGDSAQIRTRSESRVR